MVVPSPRASASILAGEAGLANAGTRGDNAAAGRYTDAMLRTDADTLKSPVPAPAAPGDPEGVLTAWLHTYVAFDWGDEIDLTHARRLGPSVVLDLSRRPRTPSSIAFKPAPLRFTLQPIVFNLPGVAGAPTGSCEATVFDFAVVSVAIRL